MEAWNPSRVPDGHGGVGGLSWARRAWNPSRMEPERGYAIKASWTGIPSRMVVERLDVQVSRFLQAVESATSGPHDMVEQTDPEKLPGLSETSCYLAVLSAR